MATSDFIKDALFATIAKVERGDVDTYGDPNVDALIVHRDNDAFEDVLDSSLSMARLALAMLDQAGVSAQTQELIAFALTTDTGLRAAHFDDVAECRAALARLTNQPAPGSLGAVAVRMPTPADVEELRTGFGAAARAHDAHIEREAAYAAAAAAGEPIVLPNTMTAVRRFNERADKNIAARVMAVYDGVNGECAGPTTTCAAEEE